jgi:hypothetical protein
MMLPTMSCDQFASALADYLESDVSEATRAAVETHAASCAECGALLADLRELRVKAAALPTRAPERDLWAGIAARIETPVVEISSSSGQSDGWTRQHPRRMSPMWMGLAAAGLVAVTATVTHQLTKRPVTAPVQVAVVKPTMPAPKADTPAVAAPSTPSAIDSPSTAVVAVANKAEKPYDAEIARLRTIVAQRRSTLDTATINVIDRNLKIIDDAIAQCRMALRKDPASRFLMQSLTDALDTKVQLLRTAASLPSRA